MAQNKNVPSRNKLYQRRKKVAKELEEVLRACGIGTLFPSVTIRSEKDRIKFETKKHCVVNQALELGMPVPQALIDQVNLPSEPNPRVYVEDDGKAPF